jgi:hypothetical protein
MKTVAGKVSFIVTQVLFLVWFLSFLYAPQPWWVHGAGIAGTLVFLGIISRRDF